MRKKSALCVGWMVLSLSAGWAEEPVESGKRVERERGPVAALQRTWHGVVGGARAVVETVGGLFGVGGGNRQATEAPRNLKLEVSLKLESHQVSLSKDREVRGVIRITNRGRRTQVLQFPSSLRVEAVMREGSGSSGSIVARANEDRGVREEEGALTVNPGERLEFELNLPTRALSPGRVYQLEAAVVNQVGLVARTEVRTQP
jgi:hypothetical protein